MPLLVFQGWCRIQKKMTQLTGNTAEQGVNPRWIGLPAHRQRG